MNQMDEIPAVAVTGINQLYQYGALVTLLVLVSIGLCIFCAYLVRRNTIIGDRMLEVMIQNAQVITEFREMLRNVSRN